MRSPSRMLPQPWEVIPAAAPASLAESLSKQNMMQFSLMEISQNSCVHSAFEAEEAKLGRDFRAAPIPWAHIIVTGPIYYCSWRPLISRPETRQALVFQSGSWARQCSMRISTAGAYRTLRPKAHLAALRICICPLCPAIRRGISQLWSSLLPMEGQFCAAWMRGLRQAQASGH